MTPRMTILILLVVLLLSGCGRGTPSGKTPIHLNPNMDNQPKVKAQSESGFFEDGLAMRPVIEGTVAIGELNEDSKYYFGINSNGSFVKKGPVEPTIERLYRGKERYNIYCAPCHSRTGDGLGIVIKRGFTAPPTYHVDSIRKFSDGQIFDIISNGVRNMPPYKHQISVDDRWSIVMYVRALQRSQNATSKDVPPDMREK